MLKSGVRRFYTHRSWKLMNQVRLVVIVLTFPIWLPLKVLVQLGIWMEDVLIFLDDLLDSILDVTIPQLKDKRRKNMKNKELNS